MNDAEILFLGNIYPTAYRTNPNQGRCYAPEGLAPTLNCKGGGNLEPFILIGSTQAKAFIGNADCCCTLTEAMGKGGGQIPMIGEVINPLKGKTEYGWHFEQQVYDENGITRALKAGGGSGNIPKVIVHESIKNFWFPVEIDGKVEYVAIRKLTPKECFRLMGFDDSDVDLLSKNGISNTQLYKMAGNSIVVNVLEFLFCQIFDSDNEIWV